MIIWIGAALGGIGVMCILYRRSVIGTLVGIQVLMMGAALMFVMSGLQGKFQEGQTVGLFIALFATLQLVGGLSLATRLFYIKKRAELGDIGSLKH